jgi:ankyrin repeat protein
MMYEPKSLLNVSLALTPEVQALPHIVEAVNDFVMPATIDAAVYNDLGHVVKTFGAVRAWTVKAMDGAAAKGRLDIMQWLHDNRAEGCSTEAGMAAATNGHLDVVKWLTEHYPDAVLPVEAMTAAAKNGHASVVRFLRTSVAMTDAVPALEDAAVNGRVQVVDALVPYYSGLAQGAFMVASASGQAEVVRLLLTHGFTSVMYTNPSLREAAEGGHLELVDLLLEFCDDEALGDALLAAAAINRVDIVKMVVERRHPRDIGAALEQAALDDRCGMVQLLLENCPEEDERYLSRAQYHESGDSDRSTRWQTQKSINAAATAAASRGHLETAKLLASKCSDSAAGEALSVAVESNNLEMAKLFVMQSNLVGTVAALVAAVADDKLDMARALLENGDVRTVEQALVKISSAGNQEIATKLLKRCDPTSCKRVFENAAANGAVALVKQMLEQMDERSAGDALRLAAMNGHTDVVKVLLVKSDADGVTAAFNVAAMQGRLAVVELLSERD